MNAAVVLRTNEFDRRTAQEMRRLQRDGLSILVVADERARAVSTAPFRKVSLNAGSLDGLMLMRHPDAGWLLGDYFLYHAVAARPDAQFIWLIEPDVRINFDRPSQFFRVFDGENADFISGRFSEAPNDWHWTARMKVHRRRVFRTLFSCVRISRQAINHLMSVRTLMRDLPAAAQPNDESFVASVLANDGFRWRTFGEFGNFAPANAFGFLRPISGVLLDKGVRDGRIYHPVLYGEAYLRRAELYCRQNPSAEGITAVAAGLRAEVGQARADAFAASFGVKGAP